MPRGEVQTLINSLERGRPTAIIATGIDLATNIFVVHGVNVRGTVLLCQPKVARAKLGALRAALPPGVSAWKRVLVRTTGRGSSRRRVTLCG